MIKTLSAFSIKKNNAPNSTAKAKHWTLLMGFRARNRTALPDPILVVMTLFCCVSVAYGASIHERTDKDPAMCADFANMVRAASIVTKSDDELCDFRFSRLSNSATVKFTFPDWHALNAADSAEEAARIHDANDISSGATHDLLRKNYLLATRAAVADNNLRLYRAELPLARGEEPMHIEMMDVHDCSKAAFSSFNEGGTTSMSPYMGYDAYPSFAMYLDPLLRKAIPVTPERRGAQLAIWDDNKAVQMTMPSRWIRVRADPQLTVRLLEFQRMPASTTVYGKVEAKVMSYAVCEIDIKK